MVLKTTTSVLGFLFLILGAVMTVPLVVSIGFRDGSWSAFFITELVVLGCGGLFRWIGKGSIENISLREGFAIVTFAWLFFSLFGAMPFFLDGALLDPIDCFFEAMSGFTTTGATVISDVTALSHSMLFWRAMTQWLGGMGIVVFSIAVLPFLGIGGMQLFRAEVPGPTKDHLVPRVQDTAKLLWEVYLFFTVLLVLLLVFGGVPLFDAICHAFTTLSTGGFSTHNESIAFYKSDFVHWVFIVFMFISGMNFALHYQVMRFGVKKLFQNEEFLFYLCFFLVAVSIGFFVLKDQYENPFKVLRDVAFQMSSISTTTGYATADFENWPPLVKYLLLGAMFFGGCAGSTAGGMKNVRVLLILKAAFFHVFHLVHPKGVKPVLLNHRPVSQEILESVLAFVVLNLVVLFVCSCLLAATGIDFVTSGTAVISCLYNVGPAFGLVGPTETYAPLNDFSKMVLSFCMLAGRLEVYSVFVLFLPSFWKK